MKTPTINFIKESCTRYTITHNTTLGTIDRETDDASVLTWISACIQQGANYDTTLDEVNDVCVWRLCPYEAYYLELLRRTNRAAGSGLPTRRTRTKIILCMLFRAVKR